MFELYGGILYTKLEEETKIEIWSGVIDHEILDKRVETKKN
jgi:hypothetical protein